MKINTKLTNIDKDSIFILDTTPNNSTPTEIFIPSPPPLSTKYNNKISVVLTLDLRQYPRKFRVDNSINCCLKTTHMSS